MKRLYRSETNRMLGGVCAGVGEYFGLDPSLVRLAWVMFGLLGGSGVLAYLIAIFIVPNQSNVM